MILPIDLETTIRNTSVGKMKANPFYPDNIVVAHGMSCNGVVNTFYMEDPPYETLLPMVDTVIAHNLDFDLWVKTGDLWCTMVVEYLLSGQTKKFPSLEKCSMKYGGTNKDPLIEDYWKENIDTVDIPEEQLIDYLIEDVKNVELIYHAQYKKAEKLGMLPLIKLHMDALLAVIIMEFNGCEYDVEYSRKEATRLTVEVDKTKETILNIMKGFFDEGIHDKLNPDSKDQLSIVLFGGEYSYIVKEPITDEDGMPKYFQSGQKKGQMRLKNVKVDRQTAGFGLKPNKRWALKKEGFYSTDERVIEILLVQGASSKFLEALKHFRAVSKDLTTYFLGYGRLVFSDGKLHGSLNTVITATGRLSSSQPNLQNLSGSY